jgi:hypothetical protein
MIHKEYFGHWYDGLLNSFPLLWDDSWVKTIGIAWLFTEHGKWCFLPRIVPYDWQFGNAIFFVRFGWLALFIGIRGKVKLFQGGIGFKQTGRLAILFRFQTDASAAKGAHAGLPNTNLSSGFEYGRH